MLRNDVQKEGPWTQPGSHLGSKGWSVPTWGEQVDGGAGHWRLNKMSEEAAEKDLCVYVHCSGFRDKAENRCVWVGEGARCGDEAKAKAFLFFLLVGNSSFERQHLI